jgi:outer membrane protein insertion porin family
MRVSAFAISTLAAIAVGDSVSAATQTTPDSPTPVPTSDALRGLTEPVATVDAIAPPTLLTAQAFSPIRQEHQAQINTVGQVPYYQNYQQLEPQRASTNGSALTANQATQSTNQPVQPVRPVQAANPDSNFPAPIIPTQNPTPLRQAPATVSPGGTAIELGDTAVTVTNVQVAGADAALQRLVFNNIQTQLGGVTTGGQLQADVDAILNTGFFATANATAYAQPEGVSVVYQVEPIVVRSIQLAGARVLSPTVVNETFQTQLGQPIDLAAFQQGVEQLNQWYTDNGYTVSRVLALRPRSDGIVTLEVAEGVVSQINIQFVDDDGNVVDEDGEPVEGRTSEAFIRRQLQLQPGQVFSQTVAQEDLRNLYNLGLFENADISLSGDPQNLVVTYNLNEELSRSFNLGGGYSDNLGLYGSVNYRDQNVGGVGESLGVEVQVGERDFQFGTDFTSPYRASNPDRLGYSVNAFRRRNTSATFSDEVELPNGDRVRLGRLGGGASVSRPLGEWDAELGLNYTRVSVRDSEGDVFSEDEEGNPLTFSDTGIDDLTTVSFQVSRDRRNNPINPSDGSILSLSAEQSIPIGNGNILMNRLRANYVGYVPITLLNNGSEENPEVLAFNLQGGTIIGDAPGYNAFDLGGMNSVRGYGEGEVGTGRSYVLASAEYRFPIFNPVGGVLFADFGTDLGSGDTVLGEPGEVRDKPGTGFGYGLGLRVQSPIGLVRADYGFNDQGEGQFHFGIGQRF